MQALRSVTTLILFSAVLLFFATPQAPAQDDPHPGFTLYVSQVDLAGLVRISWTKQSDVDFAMFYVYRAFLPFADSTSFVLVDSTRSMSYEDHLPNKNISTGEKYAYYVIGRTTLGLFMKTNTVTVEVPGIPPQNAFHLQARIEGGVVLLQWERQRFTLSTPFSVYRINLPAMPPAVVQIMGGDTVLLGTTMDTSYVDSLSPVLMNMGPTPRFSAYFISAMTTGNVLIRSSLALVSLSNANNYDEVKIISTPVLTAQVGVQYAYDVNAVSSDSTAVVRYFVENPLSSVFIECDSITGVITITPSIRRIIPVYAIAKSSKGGSAAQEFQITVSGANGIISGKVTDTLDNPVQGVLIDILKRDAKASFSFHAVTDSLGHYRVTQIDLGSYYIHAIPLKGDFLDQWYDGKSTAVDANPVIVADSPSVAIVEFKLRKMNTRATPSFTVQGKVCDTLGLPLSIIGTQVFFVDAEFAFNAISIRPHMELNRDVDFRLDGNSRFVYRAGVDSSGAFSMKIPTGTYIAFARAPGYSIQFYKDKSYFLLADVIKLVADSIGINFNLSPLPPIALGEISGQVLDTVKDAGVRARLIAFREVWTLAVDQNSIRAFFTETDSLGSYAFKDLLPGFYYIFALPVGNYAPVFYSDGSQGVRWDRASRIAVSGNSISGIDLYPHPLPDSARGYTMIKGSVVLSANTVTPFSGAMVFASYKNGGIVGYTVTDSHGEFIIDGLAPRLYTVSADVPGYALLSSADTSPSYDVWSNALAGTVFLSLSPATFGASSVHAATKTLPTEYSLEQNYPNPFNPTTRILYTVPMSGWVSLRVYNILGQVVATLVDVYQNAGAYDVQFNAPTLSSGVYIYRIESGSFVAVKKMLLLK